MNFTGKKIILPKNPNFKIGFTTQNFLKVLPIGKNNIKKCIDFANSEGFYFMEIRDPDAALTLDDCREIAKYAEEKNIEISYAINVGFLDPKFDEVYSKGLANAGIFTNGTKTLRTPASGPEFSADPKKEYWTSQEFDKLIAVAGKAAHEAKDKGIKLSVENAFEGFKGDGKTAFGTLEFFASVTKNIYWQFDCANPFAISRVHSNLSDVSTFLKNNASRITYLHLKSSNNSHKVSDFLEENELAISFVLEEIGKNNVTHVAIELPQQATYEECVLNHKKSIEFLVENY